MRGPVVYVKVTKQRLGDIDGSRYQRGPSQPLPVGTLRWPSPVSDRHSLSSFCKSFLNSPCNCFLYPPYVSDVRTRCQLLGRPAWEDAGPATGIDVGAPSLWCQQQERVRVSAPAAGQSNMRPSWEDRTSLCPGHRCGWDRGEGSEWGFGRSPCAWCLLLAGAGRVSAFSPYLAMWVDPMYVFLWLV